MLENLLSRMFPPSFSGAIRDWDYPVEQSLDEQGECGTAQPKKYRDGIERVLSEGE